LIILTKLPEERKIKNHIDYDFHVKKNVTGGSIGFQKKMSKVRIRKKQAISLQLAEYFLHNQGRRNKGEGVAG
jgi:hypothetical protein